MNEEQIFSEALLIESPAERAEFLRTACSHNEELHQRMESLVCSHFEADEFLNHSPIDAYKPTFITGLSDVPEAEGDLEFLKPSPKEGVISELGDHEVLSVIGRGGLGVVLKARDPRLNRIVAIKVPASEFAANAFARQRFAREARAAAAVAHDHVVRIYAVGEDGSVPYLVMEFVNGPSLQERIDETGPLDLLDILRVGMQTARGLAAAHAQGLVHRDIKPANILLEDDHRAKLTDFGIARAVDDVSITKTGMVAGTPQYMSPEQANGRSVDHRSDLFSLGSVLYVMCTGRAAFRANSAMAMLKRVCEDQERPVCEVNPTIPKWLSDIVDCLLAKNPGDRIQTADEVADLLENRLAQLQEPGAIDESELLLHRDRIDAVAQKLLDRAVLITTSVAVFTLLIGFGFVLASLTGELHWFWTTTGWVSLIEGGSTLLCLRLMKQRHNIDAARVAAWPLIALNPPTLVCMPISTYATALMYRSDVTDLVQQERGRATPLRNLVIALTLLALAAVLVFVTCVDHPYDRVDGFLNDMGTVEVDPQNDTVVLKGGKVVSTTWSGGMVTSVNSGYGELTLTRKDGSSETIDVYITRGMYLYLPVDGDVVKASLVSHRTESDRDAARHP